MCEEFCLVFGFYLVELEKNLEAEKTKREMKSPKKKTAEKNKKKKKKKTHQGARKILNLVIEMRF